MKLDIEALAREASATGSCDELTGDAITRFAELIEAVTREDDALTCEAELDTDFPTEEWDRGCNAGVQRCVEAIRALKSPAATDPKSATA